MAISWELFGGAMPRRLVVCITSTEKLGSQLAMRDPKGGMYDCYKVQQIFMIQSVQQTYHQSGRSDCAG